MRSSVAIVGAAVMEVADVDGPQKVYQPHYPATPLLGIYPLIYIYLLIHVQWCFVTITRNRQ